LRHVCLAHRRERQKVFLWQLLAFEVRVDRIGCPDTEVGRDLRDGGLHLVGLDRVKALLEAIAADHNELLLLATDCDAGCFRRTDGCSGLVVRLPYTASRPPLVAKRA